MKKKEVKTIIFSAVLLVIGVLFCFSLSLGSNAISWVIGISLILAGVFCAINSFVNKKSLITTESFLGATLVAFGILFINNGLTGIIIDFIPWLLIVLGVLVIIDSIHKEIAYKDTARFVVELIIGVISLALGLCLMFIDGFKDFCSVMLGMKMPLSSFSLMFGAHSK